jgi:hypothetical protein
MDTPGIMDTKGREVGEEIANAIAALSPGPHAFLIVLRPGRATAEEKEVIKELKGLFGDDTFLEHTIIVTGDNAAIALAISSPTSLPLVSIIPGVSTILICLPDGNIAVCVSHFIVTDSEDAVDLNFLSPRSVLPNALFPPPQKRRKSLKNLRDCLVMILSWSIQ